MSGSGEKNIAIYGHSGWLLPLGFLLAVLILCGAFLLYYLRPPGGLFRNNAPTAASTLVPLSVRGVRFRIPANYLEAPLARRGGDQDSVSLIARLPDLRGYSQADAARFADNGPDSPVLHLALRGDTNGLGPAERLKRLYGPYITNPRGTPYAFGLRRYALRADSGYGRDDLYVGETKDGPLLLLCERPAQDLPSPNCLAIDRPVAPGVVLSYRFKQAQLSQWRGIAMGVDRLIANFRARR